MSGRAQKGPRLKVVGKPKSVCYLMCRVMMVVIQTEEKTAQTKGAYGGRKDPNGHRIQVLTFCFRISETPTIKKKKKKRRNNLPFSLREEL